MSWSTVLAQFLSVSAAVKRVMHAGPLRNRPLRPPAGYLATSVRMQVDYEINPYKRRGGEEIVSSSFTVSPLPPHPTTPSRMLSCRKSAVRTVVLLLQCDKSGRADQRGPLPVSQCAAWAAPLHTLHAEHRKHAVGANETKRGSIVSAA